MGATEEKKIILTRGIMASGKTTWAKMMAKDPSYSRVSRDDIRYMLQDTGYGGPIDEDLVTKIETETVKAILASGRTPIVDAMHLFQRHINRWQRLGYPIEIVQFDGVPLVTLLQRNEDRGKPVPSIAIREAFSKHTTNVFGDLKPVKIEPEKYLSTGFERYQPNERHPEAFIFDIDGTLAHMAGRSPYDYSQVHTDTVDEAVRSVLVQLNEVYHILIVSGREDWCRDVTEQWLKDNFIPYDGLYMRKANDDRPDFMVKHEILMRDIAPSFDVVGVFDDRNSVVDMWRNVGLKCFQVQEGDF